MIVFVASLANRDAHREIAFEHIIGDRIDLSQTAPCIEGEHAPAAVPSSKSAASTLEERLSNDSLEIVALVSARPTRSPLLIGKLKSAHARGFGRIVQFGIRCETGGRAMRGPSVQISGEPPVRADKQIDANGILVRRGAVRNGPAQAFVAAFFVGGGDVARLAGKARRRSGRR